MTSSRNKPLSTEVSGIMGKKVGVTTHCMSILITDYTAKSFPNKHRVDGNKRLKSATNIKIDIFG